MQATTSGRHMCTSTDRSGTPPVSVPLAFHKFCNFSLPSKLHLKCSDTTSLILLVFLMSISKFPSLPQQRLGHERNLDFCMWLCSEADSKKRYPNVSNHMSFWWWHKPDPSWGLAMQSLTLQAALMEGNITASITCTEPTSELFIYTLGFLTAFTRVILKASVNPLMSPYSYTGETVIWTLL